MRHHLQFAVPVLTRLAAVGPSDLTHVSATQLRQELDACHLTGNDYTNAASALRTVFAFLHTHHGALRNPAVNLRVGTLYRGIPLPADLDPIREALTSPDPARAAVTALLAFDALRTTEIRALTLKRTATVCALRSRSICTAVRAWSRSVGYRRMPPHPRTARPTAFAPATTCSIIPFSSHSSRTDASHKGRSPKAVGRSRVGPWHVHELPVESYDSPVFRRSWSLRVV
ncbi:MULTISPECIES: hypothetical protein [unclassified Streptomyces]|uniref:hypothetical protein n=1 Tax=unclassified Streptomyces TaxID=2593676 RepID=UPI0033AB8B7D